MNTDDSNSFEPTPPPGDAVSPNTAPRNGRKKGAKKAAATKKPGRPPKVPKTLHAVTDAEIQAGAAKKARKKRKVKSAPVVAGSMEFYARTRKLIGAIAELTGADEADVEKLFRRLMP